MNYSTFYSNFLSSYYKDSQGQRFGQFFMNELRNHNPELYSQVPSDVDCFYNDKMFGACADWVANHW